MVKTLKADVIVDAFSGVAYGEVKKILDSSGIAISKSKPDFVIIVGGDGTYLRHAPHNMDIPILKLKGREQGPLGSKGVLYTYGIGSLAACIKRIKNKDYRIKTEPVIHCAYKKKTYLSAGDFYIERHGMKQALRYSIDVGGKKPMVRIHGISNGFIITTPTGSTGYYAYLDVLLGRKKEPIKGIGVAHILPTYIEENGRRDLHDGIRRQFEEDTSFTAMLFREEGYLYGVSNLDRGIVIMPNTKVHFKILPDKIKLIEF